MHVREVDFLYRRSIVDQSCLYKYAEIPKVIWNWLGEVRFVLFILYTYLNHRETRFFSLPVFECQSWPLVHTKAIEEANVWDSLRFAILNQSTSPLGPTIRIFFLGKHFAIGLPLPFHEGLVQSFQPLQKAFLHMHKNS